MVSAWLYLIVAAIFETGWAIGLELSDGFTKLAPSVATAISMAISVLLLAKAVQSLPIGTAYAVWTGIGAASTAILGVVLFDETSSIARFGFIGLIIAGVVGLEVTGH
ncbi:multidrug efflux SMR transporter (plasmid) [Halococcus dombrowskii]|jgi:quaternary ammonium compound-resistance protein SugE|uniref:Multidrug efflux SMR transporter n=1 Tax=Halococcus dombrowskii TaxID=179637 RepID=A0AAV3SHE7_HALDO|nr:multidrug efflux SMR transporter [Halococcus dombrowskii]UOO97444.1 multidrug efflux SMR transporter [Halococcus dombrowskii]